VTTEFGLADAFALDLEGVLHAAVSEPGPVLWAFVNNDPGVSTSGTSLALTPPELGSVRGVIAVPGHDLYAEEFPIIEAYGTLTGRVTAGGAPVSGALVRGYDAGNALAFSATTNATGDYTMPDPILVAAYTVKVDRFGYLHWEAPYFVQFGANVLDVTLGAEPAGVLYGTVTETDTGAPLAATVKLYRSDTNELLAETATDPGTGAYTAPSVPYFDYVVKVRSFRHVPVTMNVTIADPLVEKNFILDPTAGDLLIVDDTAKAGLRPAKVDEKTGAVLAPAGVAPADDKSVAQMVSDLETLGYAVTTEAMGTTNPATWPDYDFLIVSSGSNVNTLASATFRTALQNYVAAGGHLLIEGGEVGYNHYTSTAFASTVLHINDWNHDQSGNVTVATPAHRVVSVPNAIAGPITMNYVNYGDEDALVQTPDAVRVGSWSMYPTDASIIAYDSNPAPEGGQIVFFAFTYGVMDQAVRPLLLENAALWLITPEAGDCAVSGRVTLHGQSDHSGVRVAAVPNGGFVITGASGEYTLPGLFAGTYDIVASKDGWSTEAETVTLTGGQHLADVDFTLMPVTEATLCRQPHLAIPDNNPAGVTDLMPVALGGATVTSVEVHVDITHTYIGDLIVRLTSPRGTTVILHNMTGGTAENIHAWYPTEIQPAQSLDAFIGEPTDGNWALFVSDNAGVDVGTLNEWCLRIRYGTVTGVDPAGAPLPAAVALTANVPNPFNPATRIEFALPRPSAVDLAIFDVGGRRIETLATGLWPAGRHQVVWQGRDANGDRVASGLYFYRLAVDGEMLTRRMLLLK
jgi:subtilisin-like proprotein convertase family protein